ncbi:AmpG family muropeptide MFS transporter [Caballeronia sp. Lep1P3]|uniref:AmpG family muropeptide MFS transporter n=1 Tax=Caballeronia sp. Lep1P3 TaxID=2878150 RepID=UPI001FD2A923|nr:AmpG family muropeptide MFS transporter [Caballeronia sp. Lep1P3]
MPDTPHEAPALTAHEDHPGWRSFLNARILICISLGFASGLPLFTQLSLLQAWLTKEHIDVKQIGLFALLGLPYTWKFVWAPLMDRYVPRLPFWRPGRRRGWMLITQVFVMLAIAAFGFTSPQQNIWTVAAIAGLLTLFSASQDIAIDAYRRELLHDNEQGLGNAVHVNAYKIAGLVPGSLALILASHAPWKTVFLVTAAFMVPGIVTTLFVKEPEIHGAPPKSLRDAVIEPFHEFVTRDGWRAALLVLGFIFLYKLGDTMATALATKFFLDIGFTMTQIGVIAKTVAFWTSIAGGIVGGVFLVKIGIARGLWIFGVLQILATFGFAWLAKIGPSPLALAVLYGFETFSTGLTLATFTAYIASTTDPRYTATQFALFTSLAAVPRTLVSSVSGFIVAQTGWFEYFIVCIALSIPGMLLLPLIAPWRPKR